MYQQKQTRDEKDKAYKALVETKNNLEVEPIVIAWKEWNKKQHETQLAQIKEWNEYFAKVKESVIYAMFTEQKEYSRNGNYMKVRDIADQVKEMRKNNLHLTTDEPGFIDPWEYRHNQNIKEYLRVSDKLKEMTSYSGDNDEIFS